LSIRCSEVSSAVYFIQCWSGKPLAEVKQTHVWNYEAGSRVERKDAGVTPVILRKERVKWL
jgi:hypothetical protein